MSIFGLLGLQRSRDAEAAAIDKARGWLNASAWSPTPTGRPASCPTARSGRLEIARRCARPACSASTRPAAGLNPRESAELNDLLV
jgi:branched-chain amino acid transport system ATP-binding protein